MHRHITRTALVRLIAWEGRTDDAGVTRSVKVGEYDRMGATDLLCMDCAYRSGACVWDHAISESVCVMCEFVVRHRCSTVQFGKIIAYATRRPLPNSFNGSTLKSPRSQALPSHDHGRKICLTLESGVPRLQHQSKTINYGVYRLTRSSIMNLLRDELARNVLDGC